LFWQSCPTHKYDLWEDCRTLNVNPLKHKVTSDIYKTFVCVGARKRVYCSLQAYCTYPMCVHSSHFHRQEAPRHNDAGDPSSERWNLLGERLPVIWPKVPSSTLLQGSFTCRKSTTWDRRLYFPSERSRAEDFFALKNPTASAGFEPSNLGTKGQHATPRPPKPLFIRLYSLSDFGYFGRIRSVSKLLALESHVVFAQKNNRFGRFFLLISPPPLKKI
jgi:hypothetical protein